MTMRYSSVGTETTKAAAGGSGDVATDAIWDAAGDLAKGTGANTAARLAAPTTWKFLGSAGVSYNDAIESGVYGSRPAASAANVGRLYMATDRDNTLYICNTSTTWIVVNPRRTRLEWYFDGKIGLLATARKGAIKFLPGDMGSWVPIRAWAQVATAPTEGANNAGTANSGTTTTLTDGFTWTANQWVGAVCTITGGTNTGKSARIASNTATVLTFADAFSAAIDNTSVYTIASGIRIQFEYGASETPGTDLFTQPASDTTTDNRLHIAVTTLSDNSATFTSAAIAPDATDDPTRVEMIIDGVGAAITGVHGVDLSVHLEFAQTDG